MSSEDEDDDEEGGPTSAKRTRFIINDEHLETEAPVAGTSSPASRTSPRKGRASQKT
jgi:hypothetical protein